MKRTYAMFPAILLASLAFTVLAQDENDPPITTPGTPGVVTVDKLPDPKPAPAAKPDRPKPDKPAAAPPGPKPAAKPATTKPATTKPEGTRPGGLSREEDAALQGLMGDRESTRETPSPGQPSRETARPVGEEPVVEEPSRDVPVARPTREPADSAVPEVPVGDDEPLAGAGRVEEQDLWDSDGGPADAPLSDYRLPETVDPGLGMETSLPEETGSEPVVDTETKGSPASTIIAGLIILAVLLVALAAVVGVMAAQKTRPAGSAAAAPVAEVWAYLSASGAPNISLQKSPFLMGSAAEADLRLADPKASPHHARIDRTDDGFILTDLNSTNGTHLNGERIASPVSLRPGDEIQMGDISVSFEIHD